MSPRPATTTRMQFTACILGDEELRRYASAAAAALGLRVDCSNPAILVLLPGFDHDAACSAAQHAAVIVACCTAVPEAAELGLLPPAARVAAAPEALDQLLSEGYPPLPQGVAVHLSAITVSAPERLPGAIREALLLAECLAGGRCTPPYTRVRWRPRCAPGRGS